MSAAIPFSPAPTAEQVAAYNNTVLFAVAKNLMTITRYSDGRVVSHPEFWLIGPRFSDGIYQDSIPLGHGFSFRTAEELGFDNAEILLFCEFRKQHWDAHGRLKPEKVLRPIIARCIRVTDAMAGQIAAWYRRRHILCALGR